MPSFSVELMQRIEGVQRAGLVGSCIGRDLMRCMFPQLSLRDTFWRVSTPALVNKIPAPDGYKHHVPAEDQAFFSRSLDKDYDLDVFFKDNAIVIFDQFRDIYGTFVLTNGSYITNEVKLQKYNIQEFLQIDREITSYPAYYPNEWLNSARLLADIVNRSDSFVVLCPIVATNGVRDGALFDNRYGWDAFQARSINTISYYMNEILFLLIRNSVMLPKVHHFAESDIAHEYGPGSTHLHNQYYAAMTAEFRIRLSAGYYDARPDSRQSELMIEQFMKLWQIDADCGYGQSNYDVQSVAPGHA